MCVFNLYVVTKFFTRFQGSLIHDPTLWVYWVLKIPVYIKQEVAPPLANVEDTS